MNRMALQVEIRPSGRSSLLMVVVVDMVQLPLLVAEQAEQERAVLVLMQVLAPMAQMEEPTRHKWRVVLVLFRVLLMY